LINISTEKVHSIFLYGLKHNNKIVCFKESKNTILLVKTKVQECMIGKDSYRLEIEYPRLLIPPIGQLQQRLIKSQDSSKRAIVLQDKSTELTTQYIDSKNPVMALEAASFLLQCFKDGYSLETHILNSLAYIYIVHDQLLEANEILSEAHVQINKSKGRYTADTLDSIVLIYYNRGIYNCKIREYKKALVDFEKVERIIEENNYKGSMTGVMMTLCLQDNEIRISESFASELKSGRLMVSSLVNDNIKSLKEKLG
jgi:hypothetical protein